MAAAAGGLLALALLCAPTPLRANWDEPDETDVAAPSAAVRPPDGVDASRGDIVAPADVTGEPSVPGRGEEETGSDFATEGRGEDARPGRDTASEGPQGAAPEDAPEDGQESGREVGQNRGDAPAWAPAAERHQDAAGEAAATGAAPGDTATGGDRGAETGACRDAPGAAGADVPAPGISPGKAREEDNTPAKGEGAPKAPATRAPAPEGLAPGGRAPSPEASHAPPPNTPAPSSADGVAPAGRRGYSSEPWLSPGAHIVRGRVSRMDRWPVRQPVTGLERVPERERAMERRRVDGEDVVVRGRVERLDAGQSVAVPRLSVPLLPGEGGVALEESADLLGFETALHHEPLDSEGWPLRWGRTPLFRPDTRMPGGGGGERTSSGTLLRDLARPVKGVGLTGPVLAYREIAVRHAARFGLRASLVLAVIHAESQGRPDLVSPRNAIGLMQVQPHMAGVAVAGLVGGEISGESLKDPDLNVRAGSAYLRLLERRYFRGVHDAVSRDLCVIAAFNAGPGGLLRYFGEDTARSLEHINELTPEALYEEMTSNLTPLETRRYVAKVFYLEQVYRRMGF